MTGTIARKILGCLRFDRESYLWVLWNERAGGDAVIIVLITQALLTLGLVGLDITLFLRLFISGLFFWLIYAGLAWAAGTFLFEGSGNFGGVLRISGFAFPTTILVLAFNFILDNARWAYLASLAWFVAIVAYGMKEAMDLPIPKAWMSAIAGVLGYIVVASVLGGILAGPPNTWLMPTYRIDLRYDGGGFRGYAIQPNARTVQGVLEEALFHHTGVVKTTVAGRTDTGVHALGQVVSFAVEKELDTARVAKSLNKQMGDEVVVTGLTLVEDDFDARFLASARAYRYLIQNGNAPDPTLRGFAWHVRHELSPGLMNQAAAHLLGTHDFASFCRHAARRSTERTVLGARWVGELPGLLQFDIEASSFCHQMVRSIVALCVFVGRGKETPDAVPAILAAGDRNAAIGAAPPHGLTLMSVTYRGDG